MKYILFIIILLAISLQATEPVVYSLINSDRLNIHRRNDEYITYLRGNVHFFYDDIEFKADMADIYERQEFVVLRGNVIVLQDTLKITCNDAQYYHQNQYLNVQGNVVLTETINQETVRRITCDSGTQYRERGEFILQGNVLSYDEKESLFSSSGFATFNQQTGYGYMIERPVIWRTGADSLALYAEKIEFYEDTNRVVASFNVITQNQDITVKSSFLIYYGDEEKIVYIGNPQFYTESGDGNADLLTVYLEDNDVKEIHMDENCYIEFSANNSLDRDSWIRSDFMKLFYDSGNPKEFIATENVSSFFLQQQQVQKNNMDNNVSGDILHILFNEESKVQLLQKTDNISGKYRFIRK